MSKLIADRDHLFQCNTSLEDKIRYAFYLFGIATYLHRRELDEKVKTLEPKKDVKPMSVAEFGKQIENKNTLINDLRLIIENLTEEKNYKSQFEVFSF